ncbi:LysR family transcriptional regulator [Roseibacterium sp. SDUM158016]|uniref:LysR family transcriptional regulator n=1 Tax=Roseicyclus sediminis TaxID=2980997 RepID=UPI0021D15D17|nr:LysR family transcriptional regulator [Roseibacterium sp. SDUM158016]MCU4653727.1 LysR family transcriptional regulator [Roseibacterium sp. SDUM158016]
MLLNFDLNLLIVLHVLLEERSVTRTGARLGRTQSAISNALKRLRDHLDDPLLVRTPEGLSPTPRAAELAPVVARIVEDAGACIARPGDFDAATAEGQYAIGAPDRFNLPVFLPLLEHLGRVAPGIVINLRTTDRDYAIRLIEADEIDLAIGWFDRTPPHVARSLVFEDRFVCLCRRDHPLLDHGNRPALADILGFSHLVVSSTGDRRAAFDAVLERHGHRRNIAATLMSFTIVPELLQQSDLVGVFTHRTAEYFAARYPLALVPVPLEVAPIANHLIWHRRFERDQAHAWLRDQIVAACAGEVAPGEVRRRKTGQGARPRD